MNKIRKKRLIIIVLFLAGISFCVWLILYALGQNINLFYYPKDVCQNKMPTNQTVYLGGFVGADSVSQDTKTHVTTFLMVDKKCKVKVIYSGILPELFKPGREAVMKGTLNLDQVFDAKEVLAKHDNKYKPKITQLEDAKGTK